MALTLTEQPKTYTLSGNPIVVKISTDTTGVNFHKLHVRVILDGGVIAGEDALDVINGEAYFDISDYLKFRDKEQFIIDEDEHVFSELLKLYSVAYFETYDNDGVEHAIATIANKIVKQGSLNHLEIINFNKNSTDFYNHFINANPLTFEKNKLYSFFEENDILYFFANDSYRFVVEAEIHTSFRPNNPEEEIFDIDNTPSVIKSIPWGFNNLIRPLLRSSFLEKQVTFYILSLYKTLHEVSPQIRTLVYKRKYYVKHQYQNKTKVFVLKNQFGVYETFYFTGENTNLNKLKKTYSNLEKQDKALTIDVSRNFKANSGFINKGYAEHIIDIISCSKENYIYENDEYMPILITNTRTETIKSSEFLYNIDIQYKYAKVEIC